MNDNAGPQPVVWSAVTTKAIAEELASKASDSDTLGHPASASFCDDEANGRWRIDIYLTDDLPEADVESALGDHFLILKKSALPTDMDWVAEGLRDLVPVKAGPFLIHGSHDRERVRAHHRAVEIEANQAFGTGHHGTTHGCLEAILRVFRRKSPRAILDLGTGSGVLALAIARLAHVSVLATDIDPISAEIARENARKNALAPFIWAEKAANFWHPVLRERAPFDLVVANILAGPLCFLSPHIKAHTGAGSTVILSGLLTHQKRRVFAAYRAHGFVYGEVLERDGWVTLILHRKG